MSNGTVPRPEVVHALNLVHVIKTLPRYGGNKRGDGEKSYLRERST